MALVLLLLLAMAPAQQPVQDLPAGAPAREALRTAPLDADLRSAIEQALTVRNYSRAEDLLVQEIERSASPQLLTLLGGVFFLDGKYLNCAVAMKKAEQAAPLDEPSRFTLAMSYVLLQRADWARPELEKLAAAAPNKALYPYWIARLDYDATRYQAAIAGFQKALELDRDFVKAHDNLGLCYEALGKHQEAIAAFSQAVALNRSHKQASAWPALNLGSLLSKLGRFAEAEDYLTESVRYDPNFAQAHYQLGVLLEKQKKNPQAIEELNRAASLDPTYAEPHYALGRLYRRAGDRAQADQALATFQRLKKGSRQSPPG